MDREKVINGLHDIGGFITGQIGIEQARNFLRTIDDVIELLKEQQKEIENLKKIIKKADYTLEIVKDKLNDFLKKMEG